MNFNGVIFNSLLPVWAVTSVALLLLAFFVWKEIQHQKRFLFVRIIAQALVILSLTALLLNPAYRTQKNVGSTILLTEGYNKVIVDSLINRHPLRIIRTDKAASYPRAEVLPSWHSLHQYASDIRFVVGEGIPRHALDENPALNFDYFPATMPSGIIEINVPSFQVNEKNQITGTFLTTSENTRLALIGPGGAEDSVLLPKGKSAFRLASRPKQAGKFTYQLRAKHDGQETVEPLPIEVLPEKKLNILFLLHYPGFESRYLKNYLGEKGHAVILRYKVSKAVWRYEYANRDKQEIPRLSQPVLDSFDLVISTPETLQDLSQAEIQALETAETNGLGVLFLFDQSGMSKPHRLFPFPLTPVKNDTVTLQSLHWNGPLVSSASPLRIKSSPTVYSLLNDHSNQSLSGYFYRGAGKTGFQFLTETYHFALEGRDEYAGLWHPLLSDVARDERKPFKVKITTPFPWYINQPINLEVIASEAMPELLMDSTALPLHEDVSISHVWRGTAWTSKGGWHDLHLQDSTHHYFYISEATEWKSLNRMNQLKQNATFQATGTLQTSSVENYQPVSPLLLFIMFIVASGVLWLVSKL